MENKVLIENKEGVCIYGKVINNSGRLGQFEVYSPYSRNDPNPYALLSDAQKRMSALIGVKNYEPPTNTPSSKKK